MQSLPQESQPWPTPLASQLNLPVNVVPSATQALQSGRIGRRAMLDAPYGSFPGDVALQAEIESELNTGLPALPLAVPRPIQPTVRRPAPQQVTLSAMQGVLDIASKYREEAEECKEKAEKYKRQLTDEKDRSQQLENETLQAKGTLQKAKEEWAKTEKELQQKVDDLDSELKSCQKTLAAAEREREEKNTEQQRALSTQEEQIQKQKDALLAFEHEKLHWKMWIKGYVLDINALESTSERQKELIDTAVSQASAAVALAEKLQVQLHKHSEASSSASRAAASMTDQVSNIAQELSQLQQSFSEQAAAHVAVCCDGSWQAATIDAWEDGNVAVINSSGGGAIRVQLPAEQVRTARVSQPPSSASHPLAVPPIHPDAPSGAEARQGDEAKRVAKLEAQLGQLRAIIDKHALGAGACAAGGLCRELMEHLGCFQRLPAMCPETDTAATAQQVGSAPASSTESYAHGLQAALQQVPVVSGSTTASAASLARDVAGFAGGYEEGEAQDKDMDVDQETETSEKGEQDEIDAAKTLRVTSKESCQDNSRSSAQRSTSQYYDEDAEPEDGGVESEMAEQGGCSVDSELGEQTVAGESASEKGLCPTGAGGSWSGAEEPEKDGPRAGSGCEGDGDHEDDSEGEPAASGTAPSSMGSGQGRDGGSTSESGARSNSGQPECGAKGKRPARAAAEVRAEEGAAGMAAFGDGDDGGGDHDEGRFEGAAGRGAGEQVQSEVSKRGRGARGVERSLTSERNRDGVRTRTRSDDGKEASDFASLFMKGLPSCALTGLLAAGEHKDEWCDAFEQAALHGDQESLVQLVGRLEESLERTVMTDDFVRKREKVLNTIRSIGSACAAREALRYIATKIQPSTWQLSADDITSLVSGKVRAAREGQQNVPCPEEELGGLAETRPGGPQMPEPKRDNEPDLGATSKRRRCEACKTRRKKCSMAQPGAGSAPCDRCKHHGLECIPVAVVEKGGEKSAGGGETDGDTGDDAERQGRHQGKKPRRKGAQRHFRRKKRLGGGVRGGSASNSNGSTDSVRRQDGEGDSAQLEAGRSFRRNVAAAKDSEEGDDGRHDRKGEPEKKRRRTSAAREPAAGGQDTEAGSSGGESDEETLTATHGKRKRQVEKHDEGKIERKRKRSGTPKRYSCPHGRFKPQCKECRGSQICEHNHHKPYCKLCGGSQICEHKQTRQFCKQCKRLGVGGNGLCTHLRHKAKCKVCAGSRLYANRAKLVVSGCPHRNKQCAEGKKRPAARAKRKRECRATAARTKNERERPDEVEQSEEESQSEKDRKEDLKRNKRVLEKLGLLGKNVGT